MAELIRKLSNADTRTILALITLIGCLILVGIMQFHPLPKDNKDMINISIGFLFGSCLSPVFQFFFGSSKTESDKNKKEP